MALLEEELGKPWQDVYSELSPSPIAAGNLISMDLNFITICSYKNTEDVQYYIVSWNIIFMFLLLLST